MAKVRANTRFEQLRAENERLRLENERLRQLPVRATAVSSHRWQTVLALVFAVLAVLLLVVGNVLFWTGSTIVNNSRFNAATQPIIRNTSVQQALASYTTTQLFNNVDVTTVVENALPPKAAFLAPTVADQLRGGTQTALEKVLARQQFQDRWNKRLAKAHAAFISTVKQSGGNGTIDLNDLYQQLSGSLKNTKLSFLADKQLPPKVGDVTVASGGWIQPLHTLIVHINTWRVLAIISFVVFAGLAVFLARRRRQMVVRIGIWSVIGLLLTIIAQWTTQQVIANKVQSQYASAVRQTVRLLLGPLVTQTITLLVLSALVVIIARLADSSHRARFHLW